jgi:hypothetical protein
VNYDCTKVHKVLKKITLYKNSTGRATVEVLLLLFRTCPRELCWIEINNIVVNRGAGSNKLAAHCHEESVESIYRRFALNFDLATVEPSTKFDL